MRQDDGEIEIEMEVISGAEIVISIILIDFRIEFQLFANIFSWLIDFARFCKWEFSFEDENFELVLFFKLIYRNS